MTLKCPNCMSPMQEILKHGVHLDYCATCKGVWLDRGEIDKVLKSASSPSPNIIEPSHDTDLRRILEELRREGRIS